MRLPIVLALALCAPTLLACTTRDDDFLLLRRVETKGPSEPTRLVPATSNDSEALYVRELLANGFGAELLRTYAMSKRFAARTFDVRTTQTTIALGAPDFMAGPAPERSVAIGWWRTGMAADAPVIWIDDTVPSDKRSSMDDVVSGLGEALVDVIYAGSPCRVAAPSPLRRGYVEFLRVVGAEWRAPRLTDDRDDLRRRSSYARVHANDAVRAEIETTFGSSGARVVTERPMRSAWQMMDDPVVVATVLYRLASSDLSRTMADPAVYLPFLETRPPRDVHPALLLGAFRNFQAKLISAWSRANAAGRPPQDLIDLIGAYADAYPAERAEVTRIYLVTTYGVTAIADGVRADVPPDAVESQLAALTADVLFGRRGLRDGFRYIHN
jgi:hypothetical protein